MGRKQKPQRATGTDHTAVVWDEAGIAVHADSGLPVTGDVILRWPGWEPTVEGRYIDGVRQGYGHRYYSPAGREQARRETDELVRITERWDGGRLLEARAVTAAGELAWLERYAADHVPLPTPSPPPLREALASPDPATALAARHAVVAEGERLSRMILELQFATERHEHAEHNYGEPHRRKAHRQAIKDLNAALGVATAVRKALHRWYRGWVPRVPVARCPHTGQVTTFPIDTVDLDGWFWQYDLTVRPYHWREMPPTWLATAGAMRLREPVAVTSFEARPGPEVPYVIPRILGHRADVRAVISQVEVGPHTGWPVTYFALRQIPATLVSTWGEATYHWRSDDGEWHWEDGGWTAKHFDFELGGGNDFDLAPWLRSGKLLWIAPGDPTLTLREGEADCPYVGLTGSRHMAAIHDGQVRRAAP